MTVPMIALEAIRRCAGEALSLLRALELRESDLTTTIRRLRGLAADLETIAQLLERQQDADQKDEPLRRASN